MDFDPHSAAPQPPPDQPTELAPPEYYDDGTEPAWERRQEVGFFRSILETVRQVLLHPGDTFERMVHQGGYVNPLLFAIVFGTFCAFISSLYNIAAFPVSMQLNDYLQQWMGSIYGESYMEQVAAQQEMQADLQWKIVLFTPLGIPFIWPIFAVIACFVCAACFHVGMLMLGGMRGGFETTFRIQAYVYTSTMALYLIPLPWCVPYVQIVWYLVGMIIGLSRGHDVETWKGVVGTLISGVICCGCYIALVVGVMFAFMGIAGAFAGAMP